MYAPNKCHEVRARFNTLFGVEFRKFYDGILTIAFGALKIDILKFDDYLHEKHGQYEEKRMSMEELITKEYGTKARNLIQELI